jgi:endonuclease/exonuclease/phosphatase family metal-dependent hydrolase
MMNRAMKRSLLHSEPRNNRICKAGLKGRFRNITVMLAYAPTNDKDNQEKERFYENLEVRNRIPRHYMVIIMGDFNAKIGNKEHLQPVAGPQTIHDFSNENGNRLIQFETKNRLTIKRTMFPQKRIHMGTWMIPGTNKVNQIDHVLATSCHCSSVTDVRSCRGPNCDSDHHLVKIKARERIANVQKIPGRKTRRWEVQKLHKDMAQKDEYQKILDAKLKQSMEGEEEIVYKRDGNIWNRQ